MAIRHVEISDAPWDIVAVSDEEDKQKLSKVLLNVFKISSHTKSRKNEIFKAFCTII